MEYTDYESKGRLTEFDRFNRYAETTDTVRSHSRTDFFPNAQIAFAPRDLTRLRMAYSKTIERTAFEVLAPFEFVNRRDTLLFRGNPELDPVISNNLDLYLDHRLMDLGLFSVGVFYKDLSNFQIFEERRIEVLKGDYTGIDPLFENQDFTVLPVRERTFRNSDKSATLFGVELSWHQHYAFLPGFLGNFGTWINYTWSESIRETDREYDVALLYQSPHVVNGALDYTQGRFFTQVAYHWTAEMLSGLQQMPTLAPSIDSTEGVFMDQYQDGWSDLSVTFRFRISDNFRFWADVSRLLGNERVAQYLYSRDLYPVMIDYTAGLRLEMGLRFDL